MARRQTIVGHKARTARKRKGVHAKAGESRLKGSKNYKKKYRGQGRQYADTWHHVRCRRITVVHRRWYDVIVPIIIRYNKFMYADENRAKDVKRKVRDYWGDGYRAKELFAYLAGKDDKEDTKPKKTKAKSAVLHRKPESS